MQLHISIDGQSTTGELLALAAFAEQLADYRAPATVGGEVAVAVTTQTADAPPATTTTRRSRRTKAEIEADKAPARGNSDPEEAPPEPAAATHAVTEATEPAADTEPDASEPAAEVSGKTYTEADVQALATVVARAHGPDVVKDKIAELGGARIADLDAAKLSALGAFLEAQKSA